MCIYSFWVHLLQRQIFKLTKPKVHICQIITIKWEWRRILKLWNFTFNFTFLLSVVILCIYPSPNQDIHEKVTTRKIVSIISFLSNSYLFHYLILWEIHKIIDIYTCTHMYAFVCVFECVYSCMNVYASHLWMRSEDGIGSHGTRCVL